MGPQVMIVVREQANGLYSAGVADYCTLGVEDYPTPQGAIGGLLAAIEGWPAGWRGLWEVEAMKEQALVESVGYPGTAEEELAWARAEQDDQALARTHGED